jgi:MFS family permease
MLPLYVLRLGGTVVNVTTISAIFNLVVIPSSIFWGAVTDRIPRRREFFQLSYLGMGVICIAMFEFRSLFWLAALYGLLAFVLVANGPSANLLIMESTEKASWLRTFANFSFIANLGAAAGLLVGLVWSNYISLDLFLIFCSACSYCSLILASIFIKTPPITFETANLRFSPRTLFSNLYHVVTNSLHAMGALSSRALSASELKRLYRSTVAGAARGRTLLFYSTFFYMLSYALMVTSYVPFLSASGVIDSAIFAVTLGSVILQIIAYRSLTLFTRRIGEARTAVYSVVLAGTSMFLIGVSAQFLQNLVLATNIVLFSVFGFAFALWNSSTSVALFSTLGGEKQAGMLGAYSALSGFGLVVGSAVSGPVSFYLGYPINFTVSSLLMVLALLILEGAFKALGSKESNP